MESANNSDNNSPSETKTRTKKTEDMKEYMKEYRKKNKDKWMGERTCPDCGVKYMASNVGKHLKSQKHKIIVLEKEIAKLKETTETKI